MLGNYQARVLVSLFYIVVIPPFALLVRALGDPLQLRSGVRSSFWIPVPTKPQSVADARRQF